MLLLEQPKDPQKTKKTPNCNSQKMCILPEGAGPDSDIDLTRVELDMETCSPREANESQNANAATAELNPKHASVTLVCNPDIDCSLKAGSCGFRVGLNSGQMSVPVPFFAPPQRTPRLLSAATIQ